MKRAKRIIDKQINTCYAEERGELKVSFVCPPEGLKGTRLSKALSIILSEKDVADYFRSSVDSSYPTKRKLSKDGKSGSRVTEYPH
jgi:hypothetical protein